MASPSSIGAVAPSGEALSQAMVESVPGSVVFVPELGAGTGPFTAKLIEKTKSKNLCIVENDAIFANHLKKRFPEQNILCVDAGELEEHLPSSLRGKINIAVSGLPFQSLPTDVANRVLSLLKKVCAPDFRLIQFTF